MTERHTIHLPVIRYRDKAGNPTCAADFQTGDVCKFYRTQRLGIGETCVFAETHSGSKYADNMMRRDGAQGPGMGSLIPGDWCPVWEPTKAKRPDQTDPKKHLYISTIEASQILKQALGATSVEHVIEHQGDETFSRFLVEIPAGQVAYSAYRTARGGKAQDGSALPVVLSADMMPAWDAFAAACLAENGVDIAYQAYLAARLGVDFNGNAAPDWDELRNHKPDIAAAWADAANAALT